MGVPWGPRRLAAVDVDFYGLSEAGVSLTPDPGRWPAHEFADRLTLGIGLAALVASRVPGGFWDSYRDSLRSLAVGVSEAEPGPLPGSLVPLGGFGRGTSYLSIIGWDGPGMITVAADVVLSSAGPVPRLRSKDGGTGASLPLAALALVLSLAADSDSDGRVALAVGLEGLMAWHRESHRASPPRLALGYALEHARSRLDQAGERSLGSALDASWA